MPSKARLSVSSYTQIITFWFAPSKPRFQPPLLSFVLTIPKRISGAERHYASVPMRRNLVRSLTYSTNSALQTAASGAPIETGTITIRNGVFEHEFEMHKNDTVLVTLKKQ